ncbi:MAG TPA: hypothetical protein VE377_14225 [Candidatus Dormibacteraeota bacterium]|nr:hypothetical protein [Candidatus Dormibacteraeota bacterium]
MSHYPRDTLSAPPPEQWDWSSYRHYALGERGPVLVNEAQKVEMRVREMCIARLLP